MTKFNNSIMSESNNSIVYKIVIGDFDICIEQTDVAEIYDICLDLFTNGEFRAYITARLFYNGGVGINHLWTIGQDGTYVRYNGKIYETYADYQKLKKVIEKDKIECAIRKLEEN